MVSMIVVLLLCHPTWTASAFDLFLCQDLAEAGNRLVMDMTIECWSLTHIIWSAVLGGLMIGFGTRMSGDCTSGHGLNGCGRLQINSIVVTCAFFGTGIAVSWLLELTL